MPDLSNLLGAVYGDGPSTTPRDPEDEAHVEREPAAQERTPAVPDWADDEHLDDAFAQWKPGPSKDASPAEHAFVNDAHDDPAPPLADDLAAALSEALVSVSDTADDTSGPASDKPRFDFSVPADDHDEAIVDDEPFAAFAPKPVAEYAPKAVAEPVADLEPPSNLSKFEIAPHEHPETTQVHDLGEVVEAEPEPEPEFADAPEPEFAEAPAPEFAEAPEFADAAAPEFGEAPLDMHSEPAPEPEPEPVVASEVEPQPWPAITPQRAAAVELSAASRIDPEPAAVTPLPAPVHEPEPVAAAPIAPPEPLLARAAVAGDGPQAPTTLPVGVRRWERSDDDILPGKTSKKFFGLSLRRG